MIDIIHQSLLSNWPRLRDAIESQRHALQQREAFRLALIEWQQHARSNDFLLQARILRPRIPKRDF